MLNKKMAFSSSSSSLNYLLIITLSLLLITTLSEAKTLIIPVTKDTSTKHTQYTTLITTKTPSVSLKLTLDLAGQYFWLDCHGNGSVNSSTFQNVWCLKNRPCTGRPYNPITHLSETGKLASDFVYLRSNNKTGRRVIFACSTTSLLKDLPSEAAGVAGLGRKHTGLPPQIIAAFLLRRRSFSLCLSSSPEPNQGFASFGYGPEFPLTYTPLLQNTKRPSDYFVGVDSISIDGTTVLGINPNLLMIDAKTGRGGTRLSTIEPYTTMQSSILAAMVAAFEKAVPVNFPRVPAVAPFSACFAVEGFEGIVPAVPRIDLVLQDKNVWSLFGPNSMVRVGEGLACLGFVDGGLSPFTSVVIGGHQIEENLLEFDLDQSRLGFSSSLLVKKTTCSGFNFTSSH